MRENQPGEVNVYEKSRSIESGYTFREFSIRTPEDEALDQQQLPVLPESPGVASARDAQNLVRHYQGSDPLVGIQLGLPQHIRDILPFTFLGHHDQEIFGDFFTKQGERELFDAEVEIEDTPFTPDERANTLFDLVKQLRGPRQFTHDEEVACLRGLERRSNRWKCNVGPGRYHDFYYTNGADGVSLNPDDYPETAPEIQEQMHELQKLLSAPRTVREAIYQLYGGLPDFNQAVYGNTLGVATLVRTSDNFFMFADRDPRRVAVNAGVNCPASGGVLWDEAMFRSHAMTGPTMKTMADETNEELGLKMGNVMVRSIQEHVTRTLSIPEGDYDVSFVGAAREIARGGSPEFFFFTNTHLTAADVANRVRNNHKPDKLEARTILALPETDLFRLLSDPSGMDAMHPKAMLNAVFIREFLQQP